MNLNRLAARWERRQQERALEEQRERFDEHEHKPLLLVSVQEHLEIARAAAHVWRFVVDPGNAALLGEDPAALSFTVPGTPAGQVGERQCLFTHRHDGALVGTVEEIVDLVPGSRMVARSLSTMHFNTGMLEVVELDEQSCRLTYGLTAEVHPEHEQSFRNEASRAAHRMLARVAHHLDGSPLELAPLPPARPLNPSHAALELVVVVARAMVDTPAAPGRVWNFMLDASNERLNSADPDAIGGTVPGTPAGEVGELRCVILHSATGGLVATVQETVAIERGRSFTTRSRSTPHPARSTLDIEALPTGTRLRSQIELQVHPQEAESAHRRFTEGAERHLASVVRHLEALPDDAAAASPPL